MTTVTTTPAPSKSALIFGREPVLVVAVVEALVTFVSLVLLHWTTDQITGVVVAVSALLGVYVAIVTRSSVLAALVAFLKVLVIAIAGFGLQLDPAVVSGFIAVVVSLFALLQRPQTTPTLPDPNAAPAVVESTVVA